MDEEFNVGDKVCKKKGYHYVGTVVAKYQKLTGETRYDIEFVGIGMLHIFGNDLILLSDTQYNECALYMRGMCDLLDAVRDNAK